MTKYKIKKYSKINWNLEFHCTGTWKSFTGICKLAFFLSLINICRRFWHYTVLRTQSVTNKKQTPHLTLYLYILIQHANLNDLPQTLYGDRARWGHQRKVSFIFRSYTCLSCAANWLLWYWLHCALASCGAVYCKRSRLWVCLCVCGCVCVGRSVTMITQNYVHRSSPNWVCR